MFRFLPESTTQPAALQNNEVDLIYPQPQLDQVQQVKALPDVTSEINFGLSFEHFDFNFKNEHLADLKVRQAIATGINVQELVDRTVKQFSDKAKPLGNRIWLTGQPQYQDHFGQYGKGDVAGATKLLEEAGYTKGADGIYAKGGKKLSLRISTTAGNKLRETQGELFQAQMKQIGVDIKIANADSTEVLRRVAAQRQLRHRQLRLGRHPVRHLRQPGHLPDRRRRQLRPVLRARRSTSCSRRPIGETDEAKSAELGNQIDQQLTADMATIPLYHKPTFIAWRNTFANIARQRHPRGPFWNRQRLGRRRPLRTRRTGKCSGRGPVGDRRPASSIVTSVTSPGEGAPCSASSSAGC